jgi:hypothetical protein
MVSSNIIDAFAGLAAAQLEREQSAWWCGVSSRRDDDASGGHR